MWNKKDQSSTRSRVWVKKELFPNNRTKVPSNPRTWWTFIEVPWFSSDSLMMITANGQLPWLFLSSLETSVLFVVPGSRACLAEENICDKFHIQSKWALAQQRSCDRLPVCDNGRMDLEPINSTAGTDIPAHMRACACTHSLARD